jgi:putative hemolysin
MTVTSELAALFALAVANGLFAGAEIAMLSVRRSRLAELADDGNRAAKVALSLRDRPERFLATVQIGITVVGATAAAFGGASLARRFVAPLIGLGLRPDLAEEIALAIVICLVSMLSLVFGELVPKSLALRAAERYTLAAARPLSVLAKLARPVIWLLTAISNLVLRLFGDQTSFAEARLSPDELQQLLVEARTAGTVDPRAGEIAVRALETSEVTASALMVPRAEIVTLSRADLRGSLRSALATAPHARYPVVDGELEATVGILAVRDVAAILGDEQADLSRHLEPPLFALEARPVLDLLDEMQRTGSQLAVIVDEHGTVSGLVSLEDLLEEIVGEIRDAVRKEPAAVERSGDDAIIANGRLPIHELNRALSIELPTSPGATTIGGLVTMTLGRIPRAGEQIELGTAQIEVLEATPRRVVRVRIRRRTAVSPA